MIYTISQLSDILHAQQIGANAVQISWLLTDSRSLCYPEETLFFAIRSSRNDGHKYLSELYARGVRAFVVEYLPDNLSDFRDASFLLVSSSIQALQNIARYHRARFRIPVVGVTGSNGKTIVKEWLSSLLRPSIRVVRSPRSYNSQIGVPLSVWRMDHHTGVAIFEAGVSQPGEMQKLEPIIRPTIGIVTHMGSAHQENFSSMNEKCKEKLHLMNHCKTIIYCQDDPVLTDCVHSSLPNTEKMGWSRSDESAAIYFHAVEPTASDSLVLHYRITASAPQSLLPGEYSCRIPFTDEASVENAMYVLSAALMLGLTTDEVAHRMPLLEPVAMRLEVKEGRRGCILINDSYNADLPSLEIALDFLCRRSEAKGMHRTLILSDLLETGEKPEKLYAQIGDLILRRRLDRVIAIGTDIRALPVSGVSFYPTTESFLASSLVSELKDEIILLKGARSFCFESIEEALILKKHETTLEVNLNALIDNLNWYRSHLRPETKIVCMVKASAYGAGSLEVSKILQDHRVNYLAVAVADEGVALRKAGITTGIIVMNPEISALSTLFEYRLEPEIYNFRLLDVFIRTARMQGITDYPIHLKIDTGMHRMGFAPSAVSELIDRLHNQSAVLPRSVFSHLVGSDGEEFDEFTMQQIRLFTAAAEELQAAFSHKIIRHILNTAGIERFSEYQMDMVRLGLGLYGVSPVKNRMLSPVSTLRTTILQIRDVPAGDTVGYSRRSRVERDSRIADIPIGYADGLDRRLGVGRGYCLIHGCKAPYVGNICMDVAMVDVTDIPCQEGDPVELFGENLPVTVLSDLLDTIPYEVLTSVSERVKRVYFQES